MKLELKNKDLEKYLTENGILYRFIEAVKRQLDDSSEESIQKELDLICRSSNNLIFHLAFVWADEYPENLSINNHNFWYNHSVQFNLEYPII